MAAGLESIVLGDDQILGQLRTAYEAARGVAASARCSKTRVMKAVHVGERARDETAINEGAVSIASAVGSLARTGEPAD